MILELLIYAPYRLPGASVKFVPFQATNPPPQARFAKVTFSNQLSVLGQCKLILDRTGITYAVPKPKRSHELSLSKIDIRVEVSRPTVRLAEYNTVNDICGSVAACIPCILEARKSTAIE